MPATANSVHINSMKDTLLRLLEQAIATLKANGTLADDFSPRLQVTHTKDKSHGDLATNLAMMMAKPVGKPPRDVAQMIVDALPDSSAIRKVDIAGPGFINFFMAQEAQSEIIKSVISAGAKFGHNNTA
ncbi:MAG: hypothetical protein V2I33_05325, partial [Kangiellaceae bacterium]|nr:hypothetical protein [Kangiellaceae bacterium]